MSNERVLVRLIGHGDGPRHLRLRRIWKSIDAAFPNIDVRWLWHDDSHTVGLAKNFALGADGARALVLTEEDFLPRIASLERIFCGNESEVLGCSYRMRTNYNMGLADPPGYWGGWFLAFRSDVLPLLNGKVNFAGRDPGNHVQQCCEVAGVQTQTYLGIDGLTQRPAHYGIEYLYGTHLFWSRHYHDDPNRIISNVRLGDMQAAVDEQIDRYTAFMCQHFPKFERAIS